MTIDATTEPRPDDTLERLTEEKQRLFAMLVLSLRHQHLHNHSTTTRIPRAVLTQLQEGPPITVISAVDQRTGDLILSLSEDVDEANPLQRFPWPRES